MRRCEARVKVGGNHERARASAVEERARFWRQVSYGRVGLKVVSGNAKYGRLCMVGIGALLSKLLLYHYGVKEEYDCCQKILGFGSQLPAQEL